MLEPSSRLIRSDPYERPVTIASQILMCQTDARCGVIAPGKKIDRSVVEKPNSRNGTRGWLIGSKRKTQAWHLARA